MGQTAGPNLRSWTGWLPGLQTMRQYEIAWLRNDLVAGIVLSTDYLKREGIDRFEFPILIMLSTLGMLMVISSNDLIALYLGLELLSLSSYVIAAFHRSPALPAPVLTPAARWRTNGPIRKRPRSSRRRRGRRPSR